MVFLVIPWPSSSLPVTLFLQEVGGGGGGGMIKSVVRLLMESYAVNMQHSTETSTAVLSRAHKR